MTPRRAEIGAKPRPASVLRAKLALVVPQLVAVGNRLVAHPRVGDLYPHYLVASHGIIRASVPLMEAARDRAAGRAHHDDVAAGVAEYLDRHIGEEQGHDGWLLADLEVLGADRAQVLSLTPSATIARLVGAQYYWILHHDPVALLGYIAVLEGYPPSGELVDELIGRTRHPRKAFRTLLAHATLDRRHRDELDAALDELPLRPDHETLLGLSAISSVGLLSAVVNEVVDAAPG